MNILNTYLRYQRYLMNVVLGGSCPAGLHRMLSGAVAAQVLQQEGQVLFLVAWRAGGPGLEAPEFRVGDRPAHGRDYRLAGGVIIGTNVDLRPAFGEASEQAERGGRGTPVCADKRTRRLAELIGRGDEH